MKMWERFYWLDSFKINRHNPSKCFQSLFTSHARVVQSVKMHFYEYFNSSEREKKLKMQKCAQLLRLTHTRRLTLEKTFISFIVVIMMLIMRWTWSACSKPVRLPLSEFFFTQKNIFLLEQWKKCKCELKTQ